MTLRCIARRFEITRPRLHGLQLAAILPLLSVVLSCMPAQAQLPGTNQNRLPETQPLTLEQPLDEAMVAGIDRFALRELAASPAGRSELWQKNFKSASSEPDLTSQRERLRTLIGAVDPRVTPTGIELIRTLGDDRPLAEHAAYTVDTVRWQVLDGVTGEGLLLNPKEPAIARVVYLPDADVTPEQLAGIAQNGGLQNTDVRVLAASRVQVLIPVLISRESTWSKHPLTYETNLPHREYVYRMAFELGRHVIGYEVQKVLAAVDNFEALDTGAGKQLPIGVAGFGEGGLVALFSGAIDPRIETTQVIDYFEPREGVWEQPIYRNVWSQLTEFGDGELAVMAALPNSRRVVISRMGLAQEVAGPPAAAPPVRDSAAPGVIHLPSEAAVAGEFQRAIRLYEALAGSQPDSEEPRGLARIDGRSAALETWLPRNASTTTADAIPNRLRELPDATEQQRRQVHELVAHVQTLLRRCAKIRDALWSQADRSSVDSWEKSASGYRDMVYDELIGRLPAASMPLNPRSRRVLDEAEYTGYEVVLDVYPDVIAGGILLLPKDLKAGERRPVVVCQHGLEGTPMHTISADPKEGYNAYKSFSAQLVKRGFIVYAPQNPYRGRDRFRTLQRKSNPLKRSLFSYIIPQHERTLEWLSSLSYVDPQRIGFYGLSYGGKTAVRVPPLVPQYALSICSADFNEWVVKNASSEDRYSYVHTGEYEIFEWNMGHVANYAELSSLMAPRPFMVERGHDDGVAPDEWVAWEYAKVRRHYTKLGIGDNTQIEFFDGPHTINAQGTFDFLHRHLRKDEG